MHHAPPIRPDQRHARDEEGDTLTQAVAVREPARTAPAAAGPVPDGPELEPAERLKQSLQALLVALVDRAAGAAVRKVDELADQLEDVTARGGVGLAAALGAGRAILTGSNPLWGAMKAGFDALGALGKTLVIIGVVLSPVLLLLLLVLLLLAALVIAIVLAVRAATR